MTTTSDGARAAASPSPAASATPSLAQLTWSLAGQVRELQAATAALGEDNGRLKKTVAALETSVARLEDGERKRRAQCSACTHRSPGPPLKRKRPAAFDQAPGSGGGVAAPARTSVRKSAGRMGQFLAFPAALEHARSLGLSSQKQWFAWCKNGGRPPNVPAAPNATYKGEGWQGYAHWLGVGAWSRKRGKTKKKLKEETPATMTTSGGKRAGSKGQFLAFPAALEYARSLQLTTQGEWYAWCSKGLRPPNVPSGPDKIYKEDGWRGFAHWLGSGARSTKPPVGAKLPGGGIRSRVAGGGRASTPPTTAGSSSAVATSTQASVQPRIGDRVEVVWDGAPYSATVLACDDGADTPYASCAVHFHPAGGQFDFARSSARTPHGGASHV